MQVNIEELSPVEKKVAVEIPWPYVAQKLDEAYKDLGRGVELKGFRKGKVPRPILEKMFSRQVEQEVIKQLVQESFVAAANKHDIQPVAEPIVDDAHLHRGKNFHYSARVEVRTEIKPKDYEGVALKQRAAVASDEEITKALERKRQEFTEYKAIEGRKTTAATDVLVFNFKGSIGEHNLEKEGVMVDLENDENEPLPGLRDALLGAPIDATDYQIAYTVKADHSRKELAGKELKATISIKESREKVVPALDDEFAKDTGEGATLVELKDKLKAKILADDTEVAKQEVKSDLIKELLKRNSFAVAPSMVERQLDAMLQRARLQMAMQGIDPRTANLDEQKMRDELRESAHDEVRAALLIDAIATEEKVEVTEAELEKRLAEMAKARDKNVPRLKAELQKEGRLEGVRYQLREEKTLDLLLTRAKISVQ